MTYAEKEARQKADRAIVDHILPGANTVISHIVRQVESAADVLHAARERLNEEIAGNIIRRIEIATKLLEVSAAQTPTLIDQTDEAGIQYVEQVLQLAEQRIASVRAAIKNGSEK